MLTKRIWTANIKQNRSDFLVQVSFLETGTDLYIVGTCLSTKLIAREAQDG